MAKKSKNGKDKSPKSLPATQQDVNRAEQKGRIYGIKWATELFLFIIRDKHNASDEEVDIFRQEMHDYLDLINSGEVKCYDVRDTLKFEYDTQVKFV